MPEPAWEYWPRTAFSLQRRERTLTNFWMRWCSQKRFIGSTSEERVKNVPAGCCYALFNDSNMACSVAGITSDANVLTTYLRQTAQRLAHHASQ